MRICIPLHMPERAEHPTIRRFMECASESRFMPDDRLNGKLPSKPKYKKHRRMKLHEASK